MIQEYYFTIGLVLAIVYFTICLLNISFGFTSNPLFSGIFKITDFGDKILTSFISLLISILLMASWIIFIPFLILYPIIKFVRYINWKKVWIEIQKTGHAARLARDNQYNKQ